MHEQLNLLNADLDAIIDAIAAEPQPQEQADEAAPRPKYYHIDENMARRAHEMMSMRDYPENRATNEYRAAVDKAAALVERCKAATSPYYHGKLDALLDRYARRLAQWTNDYNRNGASCPSVLVCGAGNFPTRKKNRQNAREDSLWKEYEEIQGIPCGKSTRRSRGFSAESRASAPVPWIWPTRTLGNCWRTSSSG